MKKLLPLIVLLYFAHLQAQVYHPLLSDSGVWKISTYGNFIGTYIRYTYSTAGDTTINGHTYKKIISSYSSYDKSFMREDSANKKVYSIINGTDQLTYDFSLSLSDSVYLHWVDGFYGPSYYNGYYTVDSVSTTSTIAGPRKLMRLINGYRRLLWLEGVGSLDDYVDYPKDYCDQLDCGSASVTYCHTKNGIETFERGPLYSCDAGLIYDCVVTPASTHVDSNYVFSAHINGNGPYTYNWRVYTTGSTWVLIDSSDFPSPHFVLPPYTSYLVSVVITDTITPCSNNSGVSIYDTIPLTSPACQSLFWIRPDTIDGNYLATNLSSGTGLSYLWNFGDGTTSTLPTPSHQYATADKYEVCLTVDNGMGCTNTYCDSSFYNYKTGGGPMQVLNVVNVSTGISNVTQQADINLYPNPATGYLSFNAPYTIAGINIYNVTGSLVSSVKSTGNSVTLPLTSLLPGAYIAEIKAGNQSVMKRFIKL